MYVRKGKNARLPERVSATNLSGFQNIQVEAETPSEGISQIHNTLKIKSLYRLKKWHAQFWEIARVILKN